ncbi:MAG: hypothetical protein EB150_01125 [Nitrososphaeria archaeon]|nr:hypothetical protein [Nitrososphaeria archaeon]NDB51579.1 hypothetical protein [Nitrosopumilaceae archaeon]NDB87599.1 hypothetical protein [Nitrososphaerota archaeon]NDB45815.1 hypothetical protein [Nitrososphaeria archaeon]NDB89488.1 hypothetical protein [Nitrososphaerota archaeon]
MSHPNFAGNIIVNLANLPDFLRKPILRKRMDEFFTLSDLDRLEVINNALEAGPTIPFPNFAKLFATWLEILATMPEEKRIGLASAYVFEVLRNPQKLILFNLDGILEVFLNIDKQYQEAIAKSLGNIISGLTEQQKRQLFLIIPQNAKIRLGL